ncbi:MAG: shikimate kinase [bacterium]
MVIGYYDGVVMDNRNIILVGFMGTGKSSTGRIVAERLGRRFVDMDALIEEQAGKSIPKIFAENGEPHFRSLERNLVRDLSGRTGLVIAPGGGIVLNPENIADFSRTGLVICLHATPQMILARVGADANRPLLQGGDQLQTITDLLAKRQPLYDAIPHRIDTDGFTPADVAGKVIELFRKS